MLGLACPRRFEIVNIHPLLDELAGMRVPEGLESNSGMPLLDVRNFPKLFVAILGAAPTGATTLSWGRGGRSVFLFHSRGLVAWLKTFWRPFRLDASIG
jgi:hypothetical protein